MLIDYLTSYDQFFKQENIPDGWVVAGVKSYLSLDATIICNHCMSTYLTYQIYQIVFTHQTKRIKLFFHNYHPYKLYL